MKFEVGFKGFGANSGLTKVFSFEIKAIRDSYYVVQVTMLETGKKVQNEPTEEQIVVAMRRYEAVNSPLFEALK